MAAAVILEGVSAGRDIKIGKIQYFQQTFQIFDSLLQPVQASYRTAVLRMVDDYMAVFGGRDIELSALDTFLTQESHRCALLLAPTGRGKTALLIHWLEQVQAKGQWTVIFAPISRRYQTASAERTLGMLAQALAAFHGEQLTSSGQLPNDIAEYLRRDPPIGKRLLLVLDGLDETIGWGIGRNLFPSTIGSHLRIVAAARELAQKTRNDWLDELGWTTQQTAELSLPLLSRIAIADILRQMGDPLDSLATEANVVDEVLRVSQGDPLTIKFLVEGLQDGTETVGRMHQRIPGLEAYFRDWLEELRERSATIEPIYELLRLCAMAYGPLTGDDLQALAPEQFARLTVLREAAKGVARFISGDGSKSNGFIFSHPRLRELFLEKEISLSEQEQAESRFLDWGTQTVTALHKAQLRPEGVSSYLKEYYSTHLYQTGVYDTLFALVDDHLWYQTQMTTDPSGTAYLSDLRLAWSAAEKVNTDAVEHSHMPPLLGREIRCALAVASMYSFSKSIPLELLTSLVVSEVWQPSRALSVALQNPDSEGIAGTLEALVPYLSEALMSEALAKAYTIEDAGLKVRVLAILIPHLVEPEKAIVLQEALATAHTIADASKNAEVLAALIPHLVEPEKATVLQEALTFARTIDNANKKVKALTTLFPLLEGAVKPALFQEAMAVIRTMDDADDMESSLADMLEALAPYLSETLMDDALAAAHTIDNVEWKARVLAALALYQTEPQKTTMLQEMQTVIQEIKVPYDLEEDEDSWMSEEFSRLFTLVALAPYLSESLLGDALAAAASFDDARLKARALAALFPHLGEPAKATVLQDALAAARTLDDMEWKARVLAALAVELPEPQKTARFQEALTTVQTIQDQKLQVLVLAKLVFELPEPQKNPVLRKIFNAPGAIEAVESVEEDEVERTEVLAALLPHLAEPQKSVVLLKALDYIETIKRSCDRARAQALLLPHLIEPQKSEMLQKILDTTRELESKAEQAEVLVVLVPRLAEPQKSGMLQESLDSTRHIDNRGTLRGTWSWDFDGFSLAVDPTSPFFNRRALPLALLAAELPELQRTEVLQEALDYVCETYVRNEQAQEPPALAPQLTETLVRQVLTAVQMIEGEAWRSKILTALLLRLAELGYAQDALDMARTIWRGAIPAEVLAIRHPVVDLPQQDVVLQDDPAAKEEIESENEKKGSGTVSANLDIARIGNIYSLTPTFGRPGSPLVSLTIDPHDKQLSEAERYDIQRNLEQSVMEAVSLLVIPQQSERLVRDALATVQAFKNGTAWLQAKTALLLRLAELGYAQDAFDIAHAIWGQTLPEKVHVMLTPYLAKLASLQEILTATQALQTKAERIALMRILVLGGPRLPNLSLTTIYHLWHEILQLQATDGRRNLLTELLALMPILDRLSTADMWNEIADAIIDTAYWWP